MAARDPSHISPTAHYTAYVWYKNQASHPALATPKGRLFYYALAPLNAASALLQGGLTLERIMLQRHRIIDHILGRAIEEGRVTQIIEVACGLSPRGLRTLERFADRDLTYVEADLPDMAARKQRSLEQANALRPGHHIVPLDVLVDDGDMSLAAVAERLLKPDAGTAIITEGLVNYFDRATVDTMWDRFVRTLGGVGGGVYLSDLHLESELPGGVLTRVFRDGLLAMTRGASHGYHRDPADARAALEGAGFEEVHLHRPSDMVDQVDVPRLRRPDVVRVVEAWVLPR